MAGRPRGVSAEGWGSAAWKAALILILSFVGFILVPNRLVASLSVTPRARDALLLAWVVVFFLALSWFFVVLQRGLRRGR